MTALSNSNIVAKLHAALNFPLPGLPVQMQMAPQPRPGTERILDPTLNCRRSAVLVLLYPGEDGQMCLVLTRRAQWLGNHRGQISFPGGSMEAGETIVVTALREAQEELSIDPTTVEPLGQLSPLYLPPSNFCVYPVVAYAAQRPTLIPSHDEVAEVIEVSLAHLLSPTTRHVETWQLHSQPVRVPFYAIGSHKVWGATAMVLCELLALLGADEQKTRRVFRGNPSGLRPETSGLTPAADTNSRPIA